MTTAAVPIEVVTRVAPLGIRLWDFVTQTAVSDGISLSVHGRSGPAPVSVALNPSSVFVLSGLPGLAAIEVGEDKAAFSASPPSGQSFTITLDDSLGQFLPFSFTVHAPTRGVVAPPCAADTWMPAMALTAVPLFSSPARQLLPGLAVVRAQLWDAVTDSPAAYAMLAIVTGTPPVARGLADRQGRVMVAFPYPPLPTGLSSPPLPQALTAQTWSVTPRVYYSPAAGSSGTPGHPDLCTLLRQPETTVLAGASPPSALTVATLSYGVDLVLATTGAATLSIEPGPAP